MRDWTETEQFSSDYIRIISTNFPRGFLHKSCVETFSGEKAGRLLMAAPQLLHVPCRRMLTSSLRISVAGRIPTKRAAMSTCMASKVEPPNIAHLCEKARLSLTPQEVEEFEPQITRIVDWFAQLQEIDVADVAPAIHAGDVNGVNTLRSDEPSVFPNRKAMMGAVPELEGLFIKVPKILKENQE